MAAKNTGLGRGLSALFGDETVRDAENGTGGAGVLLRLEQLERRADQPRQHFDDAALYDLSESIRQHGILQPLAVRRLDTGYYQIIAGERRWRAAKMAGLSVVPAIVIEADDRHATELALIENLQREDLNPVEEAEGYRALIDDYGLTQESVSERVGRSRPAVANALRLLALSDGVQTHLKENSLSAGHARALLRLESAERQEQAASRVIAEDLSVRDTETLVKKLMEDKPQTSDKPEKINYAAEYERSLAQRFGRKVRIVSGAKRGKVELEFYSPEDLEVLMSALTGEVPQ
ncbi:chromosome partitioning protein ParB [Clostridia bacterium]|nr:chromosome partitioning protein ParB [Clostridia bacterium]